MSTVGRRKVRSGGVRMSIIGRSTVRSGRIGNGIGIWFIEVGTLLVSSFCRCSSDGDGGEGR